MTTYWHKINGEKVFEIKGFDFGMGCGIFKGTCKNKDLLERFNLIYIWRSFYLMLPNNYYRIACAFLQIRTHLLEQKKKKTEKHYRMDIGLYETKTWYGYKYELFGKPTRYSLIWRNGKTPARYFIKPYEYRTW